MSESSLSTGEEGRAAPGFLVRRAADAQASLAEKVVDPVHDLLLRVRRLAPNDLIENLLQRAHDQVREHARIAGRHDAELLPLAQALHEQLLDDLVERIE